MNSNLFAHFVAWLAAHPLLGTLVAMIGLDIVMGIIVAYGAKMLNSTASWKGMSRKAGELLLSVAAITFEPLAQGVPMGTLVLTAFCITEFMSLIEKAAMLGIPMPIGMLSVLSKVRAANPANVGGRREGDKFIKTISEELPK